MMLKIPTLFTALALVLVLVQPAEASCIQGEPNRVASVRVSSCTTAAEHAKSRLGDVGLPWVVRYVANVLTRNHGVVVAGLVTRKVHLEQFSDQGYRLLDVVPADETGVWFVRGDDLSCDDFKPDSNVEIYATDKCCDVFPPPDVPCLLELEQGRPVDEHLGRFLKSAGVR